jgi:O-Antigen ligase.
MRLVSVPTANLSFLLLSAYALMGRAQAIQAFALSWFFTMINPALAPEAELVSIGRYLVIAAAAISVILRRNGSGFGTTDRRLCQSTLLLGVFILTHSLIYSTFVVVSILKAASWFVVVLTLFYAWRGLTPAQHKILFNRLQWGLILLIFLSLPFLAIPSIGFLRNGRGFQGVLNHPQAFGPTVALVGSLTMGRVLGEHRPRWRDLSLVILCLALIFLSQARTAGLAMMLGTFATAVLSPVFAGVPRKQLLPGLRSRRIKFLLLLASAGVVFFGSFMANSLAGFLFKGSGATSVIDAADASRGVLINKMILNIKDKPLTGIGFGVASYPDDMVVERDPYLNLPIGAPVEKGVMPLAVVEELGVLGALSVLVWMIFILRSSSRIGVPQFAVSITLLLVNFGESMFFSVGGMGMLLVILLTGAASGNLK